MSPQKCLSLGIQLIEYEAVITFKILKLIAFSNLNLIKLEDTCQNSSK